MNMKHRAGNIIFLTARKTKKPFYRWFISNGIAVATKRRDQELTDVKVHAAIIYGTEPLMVREMEAEGNIPILLSAYIKKYGDRMEIVDMPYIVSDEVIEKFNTACQNVRVKYDYTNTFVWQSIRALSHKWIGTNTPYHRMCSEDVQRMYNLIFPLFKTPEKTNPNELYYLVTRHDGH